METEQYVSKKLEFHRIVWAAHNLKPGQFKWKECYAEDYAESIEESREIVSNNNEKYGYAAYRLEYNDGRSSFEISQNAIRRCMTCEPG